MEPSEHVPAEPAEDERFARRRFFEHLGWGGISALLLLSIPGTIRFLRPSGRHSGGGVVDVGSIRDYRMPSVNTRWVSRHGLWIVRGTTKLFALQARCTHLGCTPRWIPEMGSFRCPCHGSRFSSEGEALNGPAVRPLPRLAISVENERVLVDPAIRAASAVAGEDPRFFVQVG